MSAPTSRLPWWSRRQRGRLTWLIHLILLGVFVAAAVIAHTLRADSPDVWVTAQIQRWQGVDGLLRVVSWFGYAPQAVLIDAVLIVGLYALRCRVEATFLLLSVAGAGILDWLVKVLVRRPRPAGPDVHVLAHVDGFSFPSGHVVSYVALFGFLAYLAWIALRSPLLRWAAVSLCLVLLVLVGPSRIYLGAHWASDVLGAYLLGGLWLSVVLRAYVAWQERAPGAAAGNGRMPAHIAPGQVVGQESDPRTLGLPCAQATHQYRSELRPVLPRHVMLPPPLCHAYTHKRAHQGGLCCRGIDGGRPVGQ